MKTDVQLGRIFVILFSTFIINVLPCNLPKSERFSCGNNINSKQQCLALNCCYDDVTPKCYFRRKEAAGSPIKHSNGLCIYPKDGSTADNTSLVWSTHCSGKNSLFLVSRGESTYHIASGKCILPRNGNGPDPGIDTTLVLGSKSCGTVRFEAAINGNLAYYYHLFPIKSCIGEGESSVAPTENDLVKISKEACVSEEGQHNLKYVYQKTAKKDIIERLTCPGNSVIDVTWAYYGQVDKGLPFVNRDSKCNTNAIYKIQKKCNGKSYCFFGIRDSFFGVKCHGFPKYSIVRYTCKGNLNSVPSKNQPGKNISLSSFDIRLNRLKNTEQYLQIIVMKLANKNRPKQNPDHYKPRDLDMKLLNDTYVAAQLTKAYIDTHPWYTVGNGQYNSEYVNAKLEPGSYYAVFKRTFLEKNLYHDSGWMEVIRTKDRNDVHLSVVTNPDDVRCLKAKEFVKTWKDFIFVGVIGFQFIINIILGFLVFCKCCKRHAGNSEKNEDSDEISGNEEVISKKDELSKPERVSHQYEYPSLGCRRHAPADHNVVNGYEDMRIQTETEYEHVYHSLKTL